MARAVVVMTVAVAASLPAATAGAAEQAPGTGKPPSGSGINTSAGYANPICDPKDGPYGTMQFVLEGTGPVCLPEWKGKDNGGATYQGVTKDAIKVVALVPNAQQLAVLGSRSFPTNYATGQPGTVSDALNDALAAYKHAFVGPYTAGRDIQMEYVTSGGDDEAAQRADAVAVLDKKPFVVLDVAGSLSAFDAEVANAKVPVFALYTTVEETLKQAPYRWGQQDNAAAQINGGEFVGKQVAGKKAVYAGDASMHDKTRTLGLVVNSVQDPSYFTDTLAKYHAKVAPDATFTYTGTAASAGDSAIAQQQAPVAIAKLKQAGVTTILLLADPAMVTAMTTQATAQDYHPEWVYLGSGNIDFPLLARNYDQAQWAHSFGLANVWPGSPTAATTVPTVVQWYWGNKGTFGIAYSNAISWLVSGIMYAGPKLTPDTLKQGWFSIPAGGGSANPDPTLRNVGVRFGYGHTNNLGYEEYSRGNKDFSATWWDPGTVGPPTLGFPGGQGTGWYLDNAKRYAAGDWPTKPMTFFDKSKAIYQFESATAPPKVLPCTGCPSQTGQGTPGVSSS